MTSPSKRKGDAFEREMVNTLATHGLPCIRVGAQPGRRDAYDLDQARLGRIECKRRKDGFRELYSWLESSDVLAMRADRKEPVVAMRLSHFLKLLEAPDAP